MFLNDWQLLPSKVSGCEKISKVNLEIYQAFLMQQPCRPKYTHLSLFHGASPPTSECVVTIFAGYHFVILGLESSQPAEIA
jgi:hypothetical protein